MRGGFGRRSFFLAGFFRSSKRGSRVSAGLPQCLDMIRNRTSALGIFVSPPTFLGYIDKFEQGTLVLPDPMLSVGVCTNN